VEEDKMTISVMKASAEKLLKSAVRTKLLEWASGMGFLLEFFFFQSFKYKQL
jgi:hypothetical protein